MTQRILQSMDGDSVNSITETEESTAVAKTIEECFYDLAGMLDLPEHHSLFQLDATTTTTPPVMTVPSNVRSIQWIKYNNLEDDDESVSYKLVNYMPFPDFLEMVGGLNADVDDNVEQYTFTDNSDTFTLKYFSDRFPRWWTSHDDYNIIFDAVNTDEDTILQASKSMAYGLIAPTFTQSDAFTPDLDHNQFALLLNEAKSQCFVDLKQAPNPKAEQKARRNLIATQKKKENVGYPDTQSYYYKYPNYGRK